MPGQVPTKVLPEQHTVRLQDCCTGAHFEPNTGNENRLPTTAIAAKIAVTVNFFKFDL